MAYLHFGARFHVSVLNRRTLSFVKQIAAKTPLRSAAGRMKLITWAISIVPGVLAGAGLTWLWHRVFPSAHAIEILLWSLLVLLCVQAAMLFVVAGLEK